MSHVTEPFAPVLAPATASPRRRAIRTPRLLIVLLSTVLLAGATTGCGVVSDVYKALSCILNPGSYCGDDAGENKPAQDCLPKGPALCGPTWDTDNDTISTATELNPTNRTTNYPISGFYSFDTLAWDINRSHAALGPTDGFLDFGMNLRDQGTGYSHYLGTDQVDTDDWGTGHLLRLIEGAGRGWADSVRLKMYPRVLSGDMSLRTGGSFPPHVSHRNGLDVDMRYVRKDRSETDTLNICTQPSLYDTATTLSLLNIITFRAGNGRNGRPTVVSVFADTTCLGIFNPEGTDYIKHDTTHKNHFHVRIQDPDDPPN